jgi:hypothetical protein
MFFVENYLKRGKSNREKCERKRKNWEREKDKVDKSFIYLFPLLKPVQC